MPQAPGLRRVVALQGRQDDGQGGARVALNGFNALSAAQAAAEAKEWADLLVVEGANAGVVFTRMEMFKEVGSDYAINLFKKLLTPPA